MRANVLLVSGGLLLIFVLFVLQVRPEAKLPAAPESATSPPITSQSSIPNFLLDNFPNTDFSIVDPALALALAGTPNKDNIPALSNPKFVTLSQSNIDDGVQTIALLSDQGVKLYPYNILTWHEIINDKFYGTPVAVTFCPLCGSAIVYRREVNDEVLEFGVSGALSESNMVMYDRTNENLWQQSTGRGLTGSAVGQMLELFPMQLTTVGEARLKYPQAQILSQDTGFERDYERNPYSGYEQDNERFLFRPSEFSAEFPAKEIMVVFKVGEQTVASQWSSIPGTQAYTVDNSTFTLQKQDGELMITSETGETIPFYFEMWFSVAVQHGAALVVI